MRPDHVYFLCVALIVIPLLPFSRAAAVVGLAWLPGQFSYLLGFDPRLVDIVVAACAFVATSAMAANERDQAIGFLYLPTIVIHLSALAGGTTAYDAWWLDWYFAMARVLLLPTTINLHALREVYAAFKRRREWDDLTWRRVLCWRFG